MFRSKKPNSSRGVRHARKFRLRTDASRDTQCSRALNTQLPPRNCWRHYPPRYSNGWAEFWSEPMKLIVDKLNHAHWLRMWNSVSYVDRNNILLLYLWNVFHQSQLRKQCDITQGIMLNNVLPVISLLCLQLGILITYLLHHLRGNCIPNLNWTCFVHYFKLSTLFWKLNIGILKQIFRETQKWH